MEAEGAPFGAPTFASCWFPPSFTLGIDCPAIEYDGADPLGFVISANSERRHMTVNELAAAARRIANVAKGGAGGFTVKPNSDGTNVPSPPRADETAVKPVTLEEASARLGVHVKTVKRSRFVAEHGTPELTEAMDTNKIKIGKAEQIAKLPKEEQPQRLAEAVAPKVKAKVEAAPPLGRAATRLRGAKACSTRTTRPARRSRR